MDDTLVVITQGSIVFLFAYLAESSFCKMFKLCTEGDSSRKGLAYTLFHLIGRKELVFHLTINES